MKSQDKPVYLSFDIEALSLNDLKIKYPTILYSDWFKDEEFANKPADAGRYEICFDYPTSQNKDWNEQKQLLGKKEIVPTAAVLVQALICHFQKTGERLLKDSYSRTLDIDSYGFRVSVGYFDARGLGIRGDSDGDRDSDLGLSASRNFQPLEPGKLDSRLSDLPLELIINGETYVKKQ